MSAYLCRRRANEDACVNGRMATAAASAASRGVDTPVDVRAPWQSDWGLRRTVSVVARDELRLIEFFEIELLLDPLKRSVTDRSVRAERHESITLGRRD